MLVSHYMIVAALIACLLQDPIDSLIRDLGDDSIEVRERAERELIKTGFQAIEALKKAATSNDAEVATRARRVWLTLDRSERERVHDAEQMRERLSKLHPDFVREWKGKPLKLEGAYFDFSSFLTPKGVFIESQIHHLLMAYGGGILGKVSIDLVSLQDAQGLEVEVELCATCSPGIMVARTRDAGPLKARLAGVQTWFSRYPLEFSEPRNGQVQEVGDMTVEIAWPVIKVASKNGWRADSIRNASNYFQFELKAGARSERPKRLRGGRMGPRCGAGIELRRPGWCNCETGPVAPDPMNKPKRTHSMEFQSDTGDIPLEDVASIRCTIWKPLEIPIDFTVELNPTKAE